MSESSQEAHRPELRDPQFNLYTADIVASLRFYRDLLGLTESFRVPREGEPAHVELDLGPLKLGLATVRALRDEHGISGGGGSPRGEVVLWVDEVDAVYSWMTAHGVPTLRSPTNFEGTGSHGGYVLRSARVTDPDGNPVVFVTRLPSPVAPRGERTADSSGRPEFRGSLVNLYVRDCERSVRFYSDLLGFVETFRSPPEGSPDHVEMTLGALALGLSTREALRRDHGMSAGDGPPRAEIVLWTDDVESAHSWMTAQDVPSLRAPHDFGGALSAAWVLDPDRNPVQIVARRDRH